MRKTIEDVVERIVMLNGEIEDLKDEREKLYKLVIAELGEGGKREFADGTKVSVTRSIESERFDAKRYLQDHPEETRGYMVASRRKASVRVTVPKDGDAW